MARYIADFGLLIQHIPRTGGTWIEQALDRCTDLKISRWLSKQPKWIPKKHALLSHYSRREMEQVKFTAIFVRHPISYYESVWKWLRRSQSQPSRSMRRKGWLWHPHLDAYEQFEKAGGVDSSFDDWVFLMLQKHPMWYTRLIEQYVGPPGGEFIDWIGRTETLSSGFCNLLKIWDYNVPAKVLDQPKLNAITHELQWSDDMRKEVLEVERFVIKRFYESPLYYKRIYNDGRQ